MMFIRNHHAFVVLFSLSTHFACVRCSKLFINVDPLSHIPIYEGHSDFHVSCLLPLLSGRITGATLTVVKDGQTLTSNGTIVDAKLRTRWPDAVTLSFTSDNQSLFCQLGFQPVTRDDTGIFQCLAYDSTETSPLHESDTQHLDVRYYPDPVCTPSDGVRVNLGTQVTLFCSLLEGDNEEVDLQWTNGKNSNLATVTFRENGLATSNLTFIADEGINDIATCEESDMNINDIFKCNASNRYVSKTCSISVIIIWPPLSVSSNEAVFGLNSDAQFTCNFGYLTEYVNNWIWDSNPPLDPSRIFTSETGNAFAVNDVSVIDNGTAISCLALFENRWLQATAMLFVASNVTVAPLKKADDTCSGWKAAFSIFLIMFVTATGGSIFLFMKLRNISVPVTRSSTVAGATTSSYQEAITKDASLGVENGDDTLIVSAGNTAQNEYVYEVEYGQKTNEKPKDYIYDTGTKTSNQQNITEYASLDVEMPTKSDKEDATLVLSAGSKAKNECAYEVENVEKTNEKPEESIYDYAKTSPNQQNITTDASLSVGKPTQADKDCTTKVVNAGKGEMNEVVYEIEHVEKTNETKPEDFIYDYAEKAKDHENIRPRKN